MNKQSIPRILFYISGLLILALGIILNTKCGLGVSPIISVAFSISAITHCSFGNMTFLLYAIFVLAELLIHLIELLMKEWYINREARKKLFGDIFQVNQAKQAQRKGEG